MLCDFKAISAAHGISFSALTAASYGVLVIKMTTVVDALIYLRQLLRSSSKYCRTRSKDLAITNAVMKWFGVC